ncbi:unnamed protein product [Closterium sp. NIES-65]|nr:unnamed protein product [Closterium sp. NIES-65]
MLGCPCLSYLRLAHHAQLRPPHLSFPHAPFLPSSPSPTLPANPPLPPPPHQAHYEASCAALLHLLAFSAPPALASVRQAAVRVCARMATVGGGGGGRVSRAPCCSASPPMLMPPVRPVSGGWAAWHTVWEVWEGWGVWEGTPPRRHSPLKPSLSVPYCPAPYAAPCEAPCFPTACSHPSTQLNMPAPSPALLVCAALPWVPVCVLRVPFAPAPHLLSLSAPGDHVVLDACTALAASLLACLHTPSPAHSATPPFPPSPFPPRTPSHCAPFSPLVHLAPRPAARHPHRPLARRAVAPPPVTLRTCSPQSWHAGQHG